MCIRDRLFAVLALNFFYFPERIEKANLFNNTEYRPLLEYGELESVFFAADLHGEDRFIMPYVSYQTFKFGNYSVNDWFPMGEAHAAFAADQRKVVSALRERDCNTLKALVGKMQLRTLVIKNLPAGDYCGMKVDADLGAFKVLSSR